MNKTIKHILFTIITLLPLLYLLIIWNSIPGTVPLHFSGSGHLHPNRFGSKNELFIDCLVMAVISILVYFLMQYIHYIDPKRRGQRVSKVFDKLSVLIVIFITAMNLLIIIAATKNADIINYVLMPMMGLLFTFLGNLMYSLKPNYFAGIRTPWALSDDDNWRKTHQLGGSLFFGWGVAFTILSLLLPLHIINYILEISLVALVIIVYGYSFLLFKRAGKKAGR